MDKHNTDSEKDKIVEFSNLDEPMAGDEIAYYSIEKASEKFNFFDYFDRPLEGVGGVKAIAKINGVDFRVIRLSVIKDRPVAVVKGLRFVFILDSSE